MRNAIITAADAKYLPAACCALLSCGGGGGGEAVRHTLFFLLAYDVSAGDAEKARSFLKSRGVHAEVIVVESDRLLPFRIDSYVSAATYSRLLLLEYFDDQWGRLVYLDADARMMVPLQMLLDSNLHGRPIGAVHDYLQYMIFGIKDTRTRLGLASDAPYFNAGVICFDWRATIASGLLRRAQAFAIGSGHLCEFHDQDALNKAFEGAWAPLDPRWNFMTVAVPEDILRLDYPSRLRPYVSHFAGPVKPWMADFPERYEIHRAWYRQMLRDSPWPQFTALANASRGETSAISGVNRLKGWLIAQRGRLQSAFGLLSSAETVAASRSGNALQIHSSSTVAPEDGQANPELGRLFDLMVAEAADAKSVKHPLREYLADAVNRPRK